jgi:hypothetical protein
MAWERTDPTGLAGVGSLTDQDAIRCGHGLRRTEGHTALLPIVGAWMPNSVASLRSRYLRPVRSGR